MSLAADSMSESSGKGPRWLRGPSVSRPICVLAVGVVLFVVPTVSTSDIAQSLAGKIAMAGWIIGAVAIIDLGISVFTIVTNRAKAK